MGQVKINEVYKPLYTSDKRYYLVTGGRGSLKSTTVHDFVSRLTYQQGQGILFTRYTMTSAKKSIIPEFKETLTRNGSINDFHITEDRVINLLTNSFILFSGIKTSSGNQTGNLKSLAGITTWIIEEGEDFNDEKAFDTIDDSIRSNTIQNRVIWIQNPSTKEHFIYKRWIEPNSKQVDVHGHNVTVSNDDEVEHIHTTYHIATEYLSKSFIKKAEKAEIDKPKWYYHNYIGGWLEKAEGVIFDNWIEGDFNDTLPYVYGLDFGVRDPDALVKVAVDNENEKVYVDEILYQSGQGVIQLIKSLEQLVDKNDLIAADYGDLKAITDIQIAGFNAVNCFKDMIKDRIKNISGYQIIVTPRSHNIKREMNNYSWNDKRSETPIDKYNHTIDAIFYGFNEQYQESSFFIV